MNEDQKELLQFLKAMSEQESIMLESEMAKMAKTDRMIYEQHVKAGFTPKQAMQIVTEVLKNSILAGKK